jgi:hypothetical protein
MLSRYDVLEPVRYVVVATIHAAETCVIHLTIC